MAYEALPKAVLYAATLLAVGLATTRWAVLPAAARDWPAAEQRALFRTLHRLAVAVAVILLLAMAARAVGHTIAVFGPQELTRDRIELVVLESRWGNGWRAQTGTAAVLFATSTALGRSGPTAWTLFTAAAFGLTLTIPLLGHAAGSAVGHTLHTLHLLGSGAWLGSLAVVVALLFGGLRDDLRGTALVRHFSPIALAGVSLAAATGAIASALYLGSPDNLATPYGRALLLKLALVAGVAWCGRANWKHVRTGSLPRLGLMLTELALATAVVVMTSVLTELEHP